MTQLLKRFGGVRRERGDGDFLRLKTELTNVSTALEATVKGLEALSEDTTRLFGSVQRFANDFHSLYPSDDRVRRLGAAAVDSTSRLEVEGSPYTERVAELERGVRAYLAEIQNLERELAKVAVRRREVEVVGRRAERTETKRGPGDERTVAARKLAEEKKRVYGQLADALKGRLVSTHEKHARVFEMAYTAYMLRLDGNLKVMEQHTRPHRLHALKIEKVTARKRTASNLSKQQSWHAGDIV